MLLKRLYEKDTDKVIGVRVLHAGPAQKFSPDLVEEGIAQGWLSRSGDRLRLVGENKTLEYRIARTPGYYCCHCAAPMSDGRTAQAHVAREHAGEDSPDANNPSGYEKLNAYDCVTGD